jgi:chromosome segregation ATPase
LTRHAAEDDVSSLGGVEDQMSAVSRTSLLRLTAAVRLGTPKGLLAEERALWETFQSSLAASRQAALQEADPALREKLTQQQEEQDKSLRAIQRVLADVSDERDKIAIQLKESKQEQRKLLRVVEKLEEQLDELRDKQRSLPPQAVRDAESSAQKERMEKLERKVLELQSDKQRMATELETRNMQIAKLQHHLQQGKGDVTPADPDGAKKELEKLTADLESAKMIIASLENAQNTLSADTRSKVKAKDMEISSMKTNAHHQQKKLDNLATQLKEVQAEKARLTEERSYEIGRLAVWKLTLRNCLAEMQSAAVILEATRDDPAAAERFSHAVVGALDSMQKTVDSLDQLSDDGEDDEDGHQSPSPAGRYDGSTYSGTDVDSIASSRSVGSRLSRDTAREIRQELEEKTMILRRMEDELRKAKEEAQNSRLEAGRVEQKLESDKKTLQSEINMLRIHCNTNIELLTKKERELTVLRDSLKVEDNAVGYISDDGTDIEDEDEECAARNANIPMSQYSASKTEALAAILAHGGGGSIDSLNPAGDGEKLKFELNQARLEVEKSKKELKMEKESLANAKMIISSLEKANKSMMEDLRSRLQESNSAIHSLLEKSMESEKTTKKLELELETLRREKEELLIKKGLVIGEEKKDESMD